MAETFTWQDDVWVQFWSFAIIGQAQPLTTPL